MSLLQVPLRFGSWATINVKKDPITGLFYAHIWFFTIENLS